MTIFTLIQNVWLMYFEGQRIKLFYHFYIKTIEVLTIIIQGLHQINDPIFNMSYKNIIDIHFSFRIF